jgi:hypothetical protein
MTSLNIWALGLDCLVLLAVMFRASGSAIQGMLRGGELAGCVCRGELVGILHADGEVTGESALGKGPEAFADRRSRLVHLFVEFQDLVDPRGAGSVA